MRDTPDFNSLIPELPAWNDGKGVSASDWIAMMGNFELAVGYSLIFWPRFVAYEGYVFRAGAFTPETVRGFETAIGGDRAKVECVINHLHIAGIHSNVTASEAQVHYLMGIMKQIWALKLKVDFPDRRFIISAIEEPGLDLLDYEITFWQAP
jgi:hypothetical protein